MMTVMTGTDSEETSIRKAEEADFEMVFRLLEQLLNVGESLNKEELEQVFMHEIADKDSFSLCAWREQEILGFLAGTICENYLYSGRYLYVSTLVVDKMHRGQHIGTLLLDTVIGEAKERGCRAVDLDSSFFRTASHEFYEHYGFRKRAFNFTMNI